MNHMRFGLTLTAVILLSSCVSVPVKLPQPNLKPLPEFTESELAHVNQSTYEKIVNLDAACRANIDTLKAVIDSTR